MRRAMNIGNRGCCSDAAVLIATSDDEETDTTPSSVDDSFAGRLGMIAVASVVLFVDLSLEDVCGAFEHGDLGVSDFELDSDCSKSDSWPRSVTHFRP